MPRRGCATLAGDVVAVIVRGVDHKTFVHVAAIEPARAQHVTALLDTHGIPNIVEGSVLYGVSVLPAMREQAMTLLKADAKEHKYAIEF